MHTAHGTEQEEDGRVGGASVHGAGGIGNRDSYVTTAINTASSKRSGGLPLAAQALASI
jgi:hypothetical protein